MTQFKLYIENEDEVSIDGLIRRIANVIAYYRGSGGSTYERTKEVWNALETLLNLREDAWIEWIPLIAKRYTPTDIGSRDAEYFERLLLFLLRKFAYEAKEYNPSMKRELAKMVRDALDSATRNPFPEICFYIREFHPDALSRERFEECKEVISDDPSP